MSLRRTMLRVAVAAAFSCAAWAQPGPAPDADPVLVSVQARTAKLRAAPARKAELLWTLQRGYPLQVLERQRGWLKVQDFEGDQGWIAAAITGAKRHHVVRVRSAKLRAGPGEQHPVVGYAVYGQVLATEWRGPDWVRVRHEGRSAWVLRELLWGW